MEASFTVDTATVFVVLISLLLGAAIALTAVWLTSLIYRDRKDSGADVLALLAALRATDSPIQSSGDGESTQPSSDPAAAPAKLPLDGGKTASQSP